MSEIEDMWRCKTANCGYVYDPERGDRKGRVAKGIKFEDLPEDWRCPICGASKERFVSLAAQLTAG
ncbi:MAG: rubredoxin [Desulfovibrio sp.]|nr:rubredoxin [Desulfovibrio sp.]